MVKQCTSKMAPAAPAGAETTTDPDHVRVAYTKFLTSKCRPAHSRLSPHICDTSLQLENVKRSTPGGKDKGGSIVSSVVLQYFSALTKA